MLNAILVKSEALIQPSLMHQHVRNASPEVSCVTPDSVLLYKCTSIGEPQLLLVSSPIGRPSWCGASIESVWVT